MDLNAIISLAYQEDCPSGDITSECMMIQDAIVSADLISKSEGIFFGQEVAEACSAHVDPSIKVMWMRNDGDRLSFGDHIVRFSGRASSILLMERVMLNFLQRLSGISTTTRCFVDRLNDPSIGVYDTRKTTPLFRFLERRAVVAGGGVNHRLDLSDMVLIKENHLRSFFLSHSDNQLGPHLRQFKDAHSECGIEIEIESVDELHRWDLSAADIIMLDNMDTQELSDCIDTIRSRGWSADIEVSGGVGLDSIASYCGMDIQRISVGSLTHSVHALDLSLLIDI